MKNIFLTTFISLFFSLTILGQKTVLEKIGLSVLIGYQAGGQGENRNFVTKSGLNLQVNALYQLNKQVHTGVGLGYARLQNETYLPFFIAAKAYLKASENTSYLKTQVGYSIANSNIIDQIESYKLKGGTYFGIAYGRQWAIGKKIAFNIEMILEFQEAKLAYESFSGISFDDNIQNYFLSFKTGVKF